jgi:hypothetical protein
MMGSVIRGELENIALEMESLASKHQAAVEKWKRANYEYYLEQKRVLAHRPEYLAHRREMYKAKRSITLDENLSTRQRLDEYTKSCEEPNRRVHCEPESTSSTEERNRPCVTRW